MGRPLRLQFPGACYFVTLQGNNRQDIFMSNQDRRWFLALLKNFKERYQLKVYGYCLMNSFAELFIETREPNLSLMMQRFNTAYTKYFNRQHNTAGHLFQGRYRAYLVEKELYLTEVTCFVHLTPLRSGLKVKPWRYPWSSCSAYVESPDGELLVDSDDVLQGFAQNRLKQSVKYLQHIKERLKGGAQMTLPVRAGYIASADFISAARRWAQAEPPAGDEARLRQAQRILEEVCGSLFDPRQLVGQGRWRQIADLRRQAIYRIWREARLGVSEIGRLFHRTPSAVSQIIQSIEFPR